jgi:hypothetical protein
MPILVNRRLIWKIGRTISMGPGTYEFTRLDIGEEADIPDGIDVNVGYSALIKDVIQQMAVAETAVRQGRNPLSLPSEELLYEEKK